jgi:hypothetical protein
MISNCCGAEPSNISEELCSACLEWAEFKDEDELN